MTFIYPIQTKPLLVVMTGLPCSGKSAVAEFLVNNRKFAKVSSDDLRKTLYGVTDFPRYVKQPSAEVREHSLFDVMHDTKMILLGNGLDVVIDSTAMNDLVRATLFNTDIGTEQIPAERYLIHLTADKKILKERSRVKGRKPITVDHWEKTYKAPNPNTLKCTYLCYENNTPENLSGIKSDLEGRLNARAFEVKPFIWQ